MSNPARQRLHCNGCHTQTNHELLFEKTQQGSDEVIEEFGFTWEVTWEVVQCRGCDAVSMIRSSSSSEATNERGEPVVDVSYFPPHTFRELPDWLNNNFLEDLCPPEIEKLMRELYVALQNNCNAAATMLARAVFEHTAIAKIGDLGSFARNLAELQNQGFIAKKQAELVDSMLEAGHASMHRAFIPETDDLLAVVDILEGVLRVVFVDVRKAEQLKKRIPMRQKKDTDG